MITEDHVSFETAKLLKEKGFRCDTLHYYYDKDGDLLFSVWGVNAGKNEFVAPTLQMVMKWLREKYGLHCSVIFHLHNDWEPCILEFHNDKVPKNYLTSCDTYEKACEAAIKYCLENLIYP